MLIFLFSLCLRKYGNNRLDWVFGILVSRYECIDNLLFGVFYDSISQLKLYNSVGIMNLFGVNNALSCILTSIVLNRF